MEKCNDFNIEFLWVYKTKYPSLICALESFSKYEKHIVIYISYIRNWPYDTYIYINEEFNWNEQYKYYLNFWLIKVSV